MCMHAGQIGESAECDKLPTSRLTVADAMAHAGAPAEVGKAQNAALLPDEVRQMIVNGFDTYFWADKQAGTCTACGKKSRLDRFDEPLRHKGLARCPHCGRVMQVKTGIVGKKLSEPKGRARAVRRRATLWS